MAAPAEAETVRLDGNAELVTGFDQQTKISTVTVSGISVSIGNALAPIAPQRLVFCAGCPSAYLVVIPDASSTYGAQTGVVVWPRGPVPWWSLNILPFDRFQVVAAKAGLSRIEDTAARKRYTFVDGFLAEAK